MAPHLTGSSVVLRPPRDGDVDARLALGNHADIVAMYGIDAKNMPAYSRDMASKSIQSIAENRHAWIIEAGGAPIGGIRLHAMDLKDRRASLAIGLWDRDLLGKGYGTEAISLVLAHAFDTLGLHRIGVRVLSFNQRAIRAYEKCGFVVEGRERETAFVNGIWHDDIMMGLLESEFVRLAGNGETISCR